jgi:hypothetical protein
VSERTELERDLAEEDEIRALVRSGERNLMPPPYASVELRARRQTYAGVVGTALAAATVVALIAATATWRSYVPAAATASPPTVTASPSGPTASPQVAIPQVGTSPRPDVISLCPTPTRPGYLPWPSTSTTTETTSTTMTATFDGPGEGNSKAFFRVAYAPYADAGSTPAGIGVIAGDREVHPYFSLGAPGSGQGAQTEGRAWWRESTSPCPVVVAALVWPGEDRTRLQQELLRIIASIPPVTAAASAARPAADYGTLNRRSDGELRVLRESDGAVVATLSANALYTAVSRDGREVAYFAGPDQRELWVARARDLGDPRRLATLEAERGVGLVWAPDGSSLMYAAASSGMTPGPLPAPRYTALRIIERDGAGARELTRIETGQWVRPLAWDPSKQLGAAQEGFGQKGPGRYVVMSTRPIQEGPSGTSNVRYIDLPDAQGTDASVDQLEASPDARFVMATWRYSDRDVIRFWPLEGLDFGRMRELVPERAQQRIRAAVWRPAPLDIGVNVEGNVQLWTLDGQRRGVRDIGAAAHFSFRFDGTALYSASGPGQEIEITELATSATRRLPGGGVGRSVNLAEGP